MGLVTGDLFYVEYSKIGKIVGLVASADALISESATGTLVYFFGRDVSAQLVAEPTRVASRSLDDLLIGPVVTNRLGWSRGYFQTFSRVDMGECEMPVVSLEKYGGALFDVDGNRISESRAVAPYALRGTEAYTRIDDLISDALKI